MADLTRDEILAMPAGKQLDELVRVRVLKRPPDWCEGEDEITGTRNGWKGSWPYSTDIAAAWQVVQSIGGRGEVAWGLFFAELFCAVTRRIGRPIHYTDVLFLLTPEDICKAALLMTLTEPT